jgi:hypothetical protein
MALPSLGNLPFSSIRAEYGYDIRDFTSGEGEVGPPGGTVATIIEVWGAAAGGSGAYAVGDEVEHRNGHGGGGGAYAARVITGGHVVGYNVGAGGIGGDSPQSLFNFDDAISDPGELSQANAAEFVLNAPGGGAATLFEPGNGGSTASGGTINLPGKAGFYGELEPFGASAGGSGALFVSSAFGFYSNSIGGGGNLGQFIGQSGPGTGTGGDRGGLTLGASGSNGLVRVIFVGAFGANNLISYTKSTVATPRVGTGQVVPDFASNNNVGTSLPVSVNQFRGGQGAWRIDQPDTPDPTPPTPSLFVVNSPSDIQQPGGPSGFTITAVATGGTGSYQYSWSGSFFVQLDSGTTSDTVSGSIIPDGAGSSHVVTCVVTSGSATASASTGITTGGDPP